MCPYYLEFTVMNKNRIHCYLVLWRGISGDTLSCCQWNEFTRRGSFVLLNHDQTCLEDIQDEVEHLILMISDGAQYPCDIQSSLSNPVANIFLLSQSKISYVACGLVCLDTHAWTKCLRELQVYPTWRSIRLIFVGLQGLGSMVPPFSCSRTLQSYANRLVLFS